jgi:tetratricopeptide (TPR) repeat protein/nucleoside-triphosphatase THEP1
MAESPTITLVITDAGVDPVEYTYDVFRDDEPIRTNATVGAERASELRRFAKSYLNLFEGRYQPSVDAQQLQAMGRNLFQGWLEEAWGDLPRSFQRGKGTLVVASDVSPVLNLPWELLQFPNGRTVAGLNPNLRLRRHPLPERLPEVREDRRPGPLRVLYTACQPRGSTVLDYEREEVALVRILSRVGGAKQRVTYYGCDLGSLEELREFVDEYRPHVVHLTGHAKVEDGDGVFVFEDEHGNAAPVRAEELALDLFAGSEVQCVFVSGCQSGQAPNVDAVGGLCQALAYHGVPAVVGWSASIADRVAISFAERFYQVLGTGQPVDRALVMARREAKKEGEDTGDPSWTLPVLYTASTQSDLVDFSAPSDPPHLETRLDPLPGMAGEGYAKHFVGRRREIQRNLPALRDERRLLLITGPGGMGKSTLATRLTQKLRSADGFTPIAVTSPEKSWKDDKPDKPFPVSDILTKSAAVLRNVESRDLKTEAERLKDGRRDEGERLIDLVHILNEHPFVLVLDNLEPHLDLDTRETKSDALRHFLSYLADNLTGRSRCIITSRYRPRELDGRLGSATTGEEQLEEFPRHAFLKFVLTDDSVRRRYENDASFREVVDLIYDRLGGTPKFLEQIAGVLRKTDTAALKQQLEAVNVPDDADANQLRAKRDAYLKQIFVRRLYQYIQPTEARTALSRAAVYTIPMTAEGFAAAAGVDESDVQGWIDEWQRRTFVTPVESQDGAPDRWTVPTLLRPWLLQQLREEQQTDAHQAAGEWLRSARSKIDGDRVMDSQYLERLLEERHHFLQAGRENDALGANHDASKILSRLGQHREVLSLNQVLAEATKHPNPLNWCGRSASSLAQYEEAEIYYQQALERTSGESLREQARALHGLGTLRLITGDYPSAEEYLEEAVRLRIQVGDDGPVISSLGRLADVPAMKGEYPEAEKRYEELLEYSTQKGIGDGQVEGLHGLGSVKMEMGKLSEAGKYFEREYELRKSLGDVEGLKIVTHQLGQLELRRGNLGTAVHWYREGLQLATEQGDMASAAQALHQMGSASLQSENLNEARNYFRAAREKFEEKGMRREFATAVHDLAIIDMNEGGLDVAVSKSIKSIRIRQELGNDSMEAQSWCLLGMLAALKGNPTMGIKMALVADTLVGESDREWTSNAISALSDGVGLSDGFIKTKMKRRAVASYTRDRGWSLLREAFADVDWDGDGSSSEDG